MEFLVRKFRRFSFYSESEVLYLVIFVDGIDRVVSGYRSKRWYFFKWRRLLIENEFYKILIKIVVKGVKCVYT